MCRLFGVIANKEVDMDFSFNLADKPFREFSQDNPHGWGIGYYNKGKARVIKQGLKEVGSIRNYDFSVVETVRSRIILSHVRYATYGDYFKVNAHPFVFKDWIFAHNGSVNRECLKGYLSEDYLRLIEGNTDSEVYFLLIMQEIERHGDTLEGIRSALSIVYNCENYTGLNFILSDGNRLYAYRDASDRDKEEYYSLYLLKRDSPDYDLFEHLSEETRQLLRSKSLRGEKAVLVSSEELTKERWTLIPLKNLVIVSPNLEITFISL
ncbi:class II glutamine amidotransferase [Hydrogenobacter sp. T-2]|uniref:class II glutamine amidotransferase n=1 Tax=Pampinifervens diazotrophicum TaxID=1632018 RepID=UPI002B261E19|nr:class II glutamine amidotransferase [Hydrogenobacter sp. T-2]WPM31667.1 class II glutamine amidotransferase [Hydrogenobacter sp. T-2]